MFASDACFEVVDADDAVAAAQQLVAQVRPEEPRATGHETGGHGPKGIRRVSLTTRQRPRSTRSSPRRSVTRSASRRSSSACAYLARRAELVAQAGDRDRALALDDARRRASRTSASASGWMCMSLPRRTTRPCARSAASCSDSSSSSSALASARGPAARMRSSSASAASVSGAGGCGSAAARGRPAPARAPVLAAREPRQAHEHVARRAVLARARVEHDAAAERVRRRERRSTSRSPRAGTSGCSSRSWKKRAAELGEPRAGVSRVPWWTCTRAPCSARASELARRARRRRTAASAAPAPASTSPRATSSRARRPRGSARRAGRPRRARRGSSWTCTERTRARSPRGQQRRPRRRAPTRPTTACR